MTQVSKTVRTVAIIGAGLIGRSWAIAFARGGCDVRLHDPVAGAAENSLALLTESVKELHGLDLLSGQSAADVSARVHVARTIPQAVSGADYVQECAPEKVELKAALFSELDGLAGDDTILASSTSVILPSLFTGHIRRRSQCVVVHPLNPPHLIPAVEVVPAPWTAAEIVARTRDVMTSIGQKPVVMMKEIDGFLMNRLQGALLEECFRLLEGGYVGVEDIDVALKDGLAMRWSFMGPFETIELNAPGGIRDYVTRYDKGFVKIREKSMHRANWQGETLDKAEAERRTLLPADQLAARQLWRDQQLMKLAVYRSRKGM